jgi:hypothetical protein
MELHYIILSIHNLELQHLGIPEQIFEQTDNSLYQSFSDQDGKINSVLHKTLPEKKRLSSLLDSVKL